VLRKADDVLAPRSTSSLVHVTLVSNSTPPPHPHPPAPSTSLPADGRDHKAHRRHQGGPRRRHFLRHDINAALLGPARPPAASPRPWHRARRRLLFPSWDPTAPARAILNEAVVKMTRTSVGASILEESLVLLVIFVRLVLHASASAALLALLWLLRLSPL
jgi:hypothetical protein